MRNLVSTTLLIAAVAAPALAAALNQAEVQAAIVARSGGSPQNFMFRNIQIAGSRPASMGEIGHLGLPPGAVVTPVRASYTEVTGGNLGRDHIQTFLLYKDDFGTWAAQPLSTRGNYTSDLKPVR